MLYLSIHTTSYVNLKLLNFNVRHHIDGISTIKCTLSIVTALFYSLCNLFLDAVIEIMRIGSSIFHKRNVMLPILGFLLESAR